MNINLREIISKYNTNTAIYDNHNRYHTMYEFNVYPDTKAMINFLPVLKGLIANISDRNIIMTTNMSADYYHYLSKQFTNTNLPDSLLSWYTTHFASFANRGYTIVILYNMYTHLRNISKSAPHERQIMFDFINKILNTDEVARIISKIKPGKDGPYWMLNLAGETLRNFINKTTVLRIMQNNPTNTALFIFGNNKHILDNIKLQRKWIKTFINRKTLTDHHNTLYITNDAIKQLDSKTAFLFIKKIHRVYKNKPNPVNVYFNPDTLIRQATAYWIAESQNEKNIMRSLREIVAQINTFITQSESWEPETYIKGCQPAAITTNHPQEMESSEP